MINEQKIIFDLANYAQEDLINEYVALAKEYDKLQTKYDLLIEKYVDLKHETEEEDNKCEHNFVYVCKDYSRRPVATYKKYVCTKCWEHHYEDVSVW